MAVGPLPVQADQGWEVPLGQAVAVPGGLQRAAAGEEVHQRHLQAHVRCRNPNQHNGSGQIAGVERLLPGLRAAHRVDHHVRTVAVGEVLDGLHDIEVAGIDGVGRAEVAGPVQLGVVGVDGDDPLRPDQPRPGDRGITHAAAADDRDRVVALHVAGVDRRADSGHHTAAQQPGDRGVGLRIDLGALALVHQRLVGEGADAERGVKTVPSVSVIFWEALKVSKQYHGRPRFAGAALTADRAPVQDDEIAGLDVGDARADRLHGACRLVAEEERVLVVDPALAMG